MNYLIKSNMINEMAQYWMDTSDQDSINDYAKDKLIEWFAHHSDEQIQDYFQCHLDQKTI